MEGERENCVLDEATGLRVEEEKLCEHDEQLDADTVGAMVNGGMVQAPAVDLLACVLGAALDQTDIWAAARLLSSLCEPVLPALKRYAAGAELPLLPVGK